MIVNRRTFIPKRGMQDKVVELIKKGEVYVPFKVPYRIYTPNIAPFDVIAFELEFKDVAEHERFWAGWFEKAPENWMMDWFAVTENGGTNEIWSLA